MKEKEWETEWKEDEQERDAKEKACRHQLEWRTELEVKIAQEWEKREAKVKEWETVVEAEGRTGESGKGEGK